jgi:hypothetical protein
MKFKKMKLQRLSSNIHGCRTTCHVMSLNDARKVSLTVLLLGLIACSDQAGSVLVSASGIRMQVRTPLPTAGALLYASQSVSGSEPQIFVFSYPKLKLLQTLSGLAAPPGFICSDSSGNVFVPTTDSSTPGAIYEFAHGGTQAIETLSDPGPGHALSCSVDPTTGNLAVANGSNVAIYPHGQSTPVIYDASDVGAADCAYDNSGNLFVDGHYKEEIAELAAGGTSFSDISLSKAVGTYHIQWWKNRLVMYAGHESQKDPYQIVQINISGSVGIVSAPIYLDGDAKHRSSTAEEFALMGNTIAMPEARGFSEIDLWHYPKGGNPYKVFRPRPIRNGYYGVAISD